MKKITFLLLLMLVTSSAWALPFVTTPSPSTYPIHWYKLKINGMYLFTTPYDEWAVEANSTCEDTDDYMWCFVEFASGKIAVYNKGREKYMEDCFYLTPNTSASYINLVEAGSGNNFYIYYMLNSTQKMYLDYDYENGQSSWSYKVHAFTVEGEIIEDPELTDVPKITVEPSSDYYVIRATGNGEVKLYVDGVRVGNPYTHGRPLYVYNKIIIKATAKEAGKLENSATMSAILAPRGKPEAKVGDINFDGFVNTGDVSELYKAILFGATDAICDLNDDGSVNTGDVSTLYKFIIGNN